MVLPPELASKLGPDGLAVAWTWFHARSGSLSSIVFPNGEVWQVRGHPNDGGGVAVSKLGQISPKRAADFSGCARKVVEDRPAGATVPPPLPSSNQASADGRGPERVEVSLHPTSGGVQTYGVPVSELEQHPGLARLRQKFILMRKRVDGGFWAWRSLAGRMAVLFGLVVLAMVYWLVRDSLSTDDLEASGQRLDAVVVEKSGKTGYDTSKHIKVELPPTAAKPGVVKIAEYLSAENWQAAEPGTVVRVWHDKNTGGAWLENDMLRWQSEKKWVAILPLSIGAVGLVICLFTKRYRVGVHSDGQEYLIDGDRVAGDDKNAIVNRTAVNFGKLLFFLSRDR